MFSTITTHLDQQILTITINRPEKLNALNKDVFTDLDAVVTEIESNPQIHAAVITGAGTRAFVAGADISEFNGLTKEEAEALAQRGQDVFLRIERCSKPIIAAVNGFALGGGCELAMACHFRIASDNARFGQPEVNLGLIPGYGGTQRLPRLIGKGRAIELLISAQLIDANTALQYGLVNHVTTSEQLMPKAIELLSLINSKAPLAVAACIAAVNEHYEQVEYGYTFEVKAFADCFVTEDMKEGTAAFLEKRKAAFNGK